MAYFKATARPIVGIVYCVAVWACPVSPCWLNQGMYLKSKYGSLCNLRVLGSRGAKKRCQFWPWFHQGCPPDTRAADCREAARAAGRRGHVAWRLSQVSSPSPGFSPTGLVQERHSVSTISEWLSYVKTVYLGHFTWAGRRGTGTFRKPSF